MTRRQKIDAINMKMLERGEPAQSLTFASDNYIDSIYNELFDSNKHVIYHGGYMLVQRPEIRISRYEKDFGQGFYCTAILTQAQKWARRNKTSVVTRYLLDSTSSLRYKTFERESEDWLDFIIHCRLGRAHEYDIVEGPMADDQVWDSVKDYLAGRLTREQFWMLTKFRYPTHQISFHTKEALESLIYLGQEA